MSPAELSALYARYGALVHRRCAALLRNPVDADDALQEVFMRVQKYGRPEATGSDLGWLYTIATRVCFDAQARRREAPLDPTELPEGALGADRSARDVEVRAVVGVAMRELDEKTAEIAVLHHFDGYTQEEVSERTGISRKTIGKKLQVFEALVREVFSRAALVKGVAR